MSKPPPRWLIVAAAAPAAWVVLLFDLFARRFTIGNQPPDVRDFFAAPLTRFAWCVVPLPPLVGIVALFLYPTFHRRALARSTHSDTARKQSSADLEATFIVTTMAQAPGLLGDVSLLLGAQTTPVIASATASALTVIALGIAAGRWPRLHASARESADTGASTIDSR